MAASSSSSIPSSMFSSSGPDSYESYGTGGGGVGTRGPPPNYDEVEAGHGAGVDGGLKEGSSSSHHHARRTGHTLSSLESSGSSSSGFTAVDKQLSFRVAAPDIIQSAFNTLDPVPRLDHYDHNRAGINRPSLGTLREGRRSEAPLVVVDEDAEGDEEGEGKKGGFGTWDGVFARCLLNIFGVIMFLRLGWCVGQAGIVQTVVIVVIGGSVSLITSLSLSAISTNGEVSGGGAYYMISRSLGPEFGGAIGLFDSIANTVAIALYLIGMSETIVSVLGPDFHLVGDGSLDIRIYSLIILILLLVLVLIGVSWVVKVDMFQLVILVIAMVSLPIGAFLIKEDDEFTGLSSANLGENMKPYWSKTNYTSIFEESERESFWSILAVFFPATTGIFAGANISGDLRNAQKNIPKGTLWAVVVSTIVYALLAILLGAVALRDPLISSVSLPLGLIDNKFIAVGVSFWGPLVYIGIFAATLSSALASFVGGPRIFQALAKDKVIPGLSMFGRGDGEPRRAYFLAFFVAIGVIAIGELNVVATLITNFFLMSYTLVNYACFAATVSESPGWRPSFKYYNKWVSLAGCFICIGISMLINPLTASVSLACCFGVYMFIHYTTADKINWGSAGQAKRYLTAVKATHKLDATKVHVKTFRPQYLVLTGDPGNHPEMVDFVGFLAKGKGLAICGHIILGDNFTAQTAAVMAARENTFLDDSKFEAFLEVSAAPTLRAGARNLLLHAGLGRGLRPNTVLVGYKEDWRSADNEALDDYYGMIMDAFSFECGVGVLGNMGKLVGAAEKARTTKDATVDVYWLSDDGGLCLLMAYLITQHPAWKNCTLRVLVKAGADGVQEDELKLMRMMASFRIRAVPVILDGMGKPPTTLTRGRAIDRGEIGGPDKPSRKSERYLRLSEVMQETSSNAGLIFVTLPVPKHETPAPEFLSWLEALFEYPDAPPMCIVRGNQQSVLTHYA